MFEERVYVYDKDKIEKCLYDRYVEFILLIIRKFLDVDFINKIDNFKENLWKMKDE